MSGYPSTPEPVRFRSKLAAGPNGCIEYSAHRDRQGYGRFHVQRDGKWAPTLAHRFAFEMENGPIPEGLCVCHSCDNPACVNPAHLWLGTKLDNNRDAHAKGRVPSAVKTHCKHGHAFTLENTYRRPGTTGGRDCRQCIRSRAQTRREQAA